MTLGAGATSAGVLVWVCPAVKGNQFSTRLPPVYFPLRRPLLQPRPLRKVMASLLFWTGWFHIDGFRFLLLPEIFGLEASKRRKCCFATLLSCLFPIFSGSPGSTQACPSHASTSFNAANGLWDSQHYPSGYPDPKEDIWQVQTEMSWVFLPTCRQQRFFSFWECANIVNAKHKHSVYHCCCGSLRRYESYTFNFYIPIQHFWGFLDMIGATSLFSRHTSFATFAQLIQLCHDTRLQSM